MRELKIEVPGLPAYPIYLSTAWNALPNCLAASGSEYRRVCVVTDPAIASLYQGEVLEALAAFPAEIFVFTIPAGEAYKTLSQIQELYLFLMEHAFDRQDLLIALGGGVIGDMTGFAAATYLRGIDFVQLPTTLLSQVDSSIGGKTGVDFLHYKNMIGAFKQPRMVYINLSVLQSLPRRQLSSGMAEAIKHGCIKDPDYFIRTGSFSKAVFDFHPDVLADLVEGSLRIKKTVVENDPFERNERALLNFGHTIGHALEKESGFTLTHGESVSLGCVAAGRISCRRAFLLEEELASMEALFSACGLPIRYADFDEERILQAIQHDKKMTGNTLRFILLHPLGKAEICSNVTSEEIREALTYLTKEEKS
ncbi:MAG: 3-dehydroquinate synthase [Lachnospiraceae bacterium]|nr:3-dehydroquinate synthase [Lachnospiraceae bacterium]